MTTATKAKARMCEGVVGGGRGSARLAYSHCSYKATQVTRRRMGYDNEPDFLCRRHAKARFPESAYREMTDAEKAGGEWEGCNDEHAWAASTAGAHGWVFEGRGWFRVCLDCGASEEWR